MDVVRQDHLSWYSAHAALLFYFSFSHMLHRHKRVDSADVRQVDIFLSEQCHIFVVCHLFCYATLVASSSTLYTCDSVARVLKLACVSLFGFIFTL